MLSKLIKHEFRATGRILLPVYALLIVTAGLSCLFMHLAERNNDSTAIAVFQNLTTIAFIATAVGSAVLTLVLMVYRFYKNLMTDEGYLMFTLPTGTGRIIWSKLMVAVVWSFVTALAEVIAFMIFSIGQVEWWEMIPEIPRILREIQLTVPEIVGYGLEVLLLFIVGALSAYLMFYAAIALGHSFANHKILLSVVFYFAFSIGLQIITSFSAIFGAVNWIPEDLFATGDNLALSFQLIICSGIVWLLIVSAVFYVLTHLILKRRLNLQ